MASISVFTYQVESNGRLLHSLPQIGSENEFQTFVREVTRLENGHTIDFGGSVKYKVAAKYVTEKVCGVLLYGGEKIDELVNEDIVDVPNDENYRKKHIFCYFCDLEKSEVHFNGGKTGDRISEVMKRILEDNSRDKPESVMANWVIKPYLAKEFVNTISNPQSIELQYGVEDIFSFSNSGDEVSALKKVHELAGVEEVKVTLKINKHFKRKKIESYMESPEVINFILKGKEDGVSRFLSKKSAYKKTTIKVETRDPKKIIKEI